MNKLKQQGGAALLIALLILLMVTLMGVSALKSGIFHERMAFNAQAEEMTFQAAETAINGVIAYGLENGSFLTQMMNSAGDIEQCVTMVSGLAEGACSAGQTVDIRESIQSSASSKFDGRKPLVGSDADYFMDYQFATEGHGSFEQSSMPFASSNYQEWRKVGPGSGQFADDSGLLDYSVAPPVGG